LPKENAIQDKLEYLGLDLDKIPRILKKDDDLEYRISKTYRQNQHRQYRYIPIKDIQILLSPTNRLDDIEEKYKKYIVQAIKRSNDYVNRMIDMME